MFVLSGAKNKSKEVKFFKCVHVPTFSKLHTIGILAKSEKKIL